MGLFFYMILFSHLIFLPCKEFIFTFDSLHDSFIFTWFFFTIHLFYLRFFLKNIFIHSFSHSFNYFHMIIFSTQSIYIFTFVCLSVDSLFTRVFPPTWFISLHMQIHSFSRAIKKRFISLSYNIYTIHLFSHKTFHTIHFFSHGEFFYTIHHNILFSHIEHVISHYSHDVTWVEFTWQFQAIACWSAFLTFLTDCCDHVITDSHNHMWFIWVSM